MGSRTYRQLFYSLQHDVVYLESNFVVGTAGAVGTTKGSGIQSITRLTVGTYKVLLQDAYTKFLGFHGWAFAPTTGSAVADGAFVIGGSYQITTVGTTLWNLYGLPVGVTPVIGQGFVATSIGGAGTGTATNIGVSSTCDLELVGDPNTTITIPTSGLATGFNAYFIFQCVNRASAVSDPAQFTTLGFTFLTRNSSVKGKGE